MISQIGKFQIEVSNKNYGNVPRKVKLNREKLAQW